MTTNHTTRVRAMRTLERWIDDSHSESDVQLYSAERNTAVTDLCVDLIMTLPKEQRLEVMQDLGNHVLEETAEGN